HLTSPSTVSAVTAPCAPSTSMSVETPWRFRFIQAGALIWYSTICAIPRRLSALTLTVEAPTSTSIRSRLECVACTRTEFWFQALTTTSPPKLSTSSRIPGRIVARAGLLDPAHRRGRQIRGGAALRDRASPLDRRAAQRQVRAARAEQQQHRGRCGELRDGERHAARPSLRETHHVVRARCHADLLRDGGPQIGRRRPVVERPGARYHSAQLVERRPARR